MNQQTASGDTAETLQMLVHHLDCFEKLDLAGTMTDYADESKFFSPGGVLHGSESIRQFYGTLFEEFEKPGMSFVLVHQEVSDDTAYIVWTAETADNIFEIGSDTFIVKDGKIVTQTFTGKMSSKN